MDAQILWMQADLDSHLLGLAQSSCQLFAVILTFNPPNMQNILSIMLLLVFRMSNIIGVPFDYIAENNKSQHGFTRFRNAGMGIAEQPLCSRHR